MLRVATQVPIGYTGKIFKPRVRHEDGEWLDLNQATIRLNEINRHDILSPGDSFFELKIDGKHGSYFIPIDLWDLYRVLSRSGEAVGTLYHITQGSDLLKRLRKIGVNLARYQAWRLAKDIHTWPRNEVLDACSTHGKQLYEKTKLLLHENYFDLKFSECFAGTSGNIVAAVFRFGTARFPFPGHSSPLNFFIEIDYPAESNGNSMN